MTRPRLAYLDNLKALLVAAIIAAHGLLSYSEFASWPYQELQEVRVSPGLETALLALVGPVAIFFIALLFLVAGLLTPDALARKGRGAFVRDRLLRLGVPFALFALLLWPALIHVLRSRLTEYSGTYWETFTGQDPFLDTGPLWFLLVLLLFSLAYAAIWPRWPRPTVTGGGIAALAIAVAVGTFAVRLVFGFDTDQVAGLHLWQWPECLALFALGATAASQGWLESVPRRLVRGCGVTTAVAVVLSGAYVAGAESLGVTDETLAGGWHWPSLAFSMLEGVLAVCGSVLLLGLSQRHLRGAGPLARFAGRGAYAAFLLQLPVLLAIAVALRPLDVGAGAKALVLATSGVVACYALAIPLVTRTPLGRLL